MDVPEVDPLYGLPPEQFTSARDALAARLRADGRRDEAAAVKALRRPTAPAAALNRVAREHPDAVAELVTAGRNLARAQERLVAGEGDRSVLREASEHVREAISEITRLAGPLSVASADRVRATLQAALLDDEVRAALEAGRLEREAEPGGLGLPAGGRAPARAAKRPAAKVAARPQAEPDEQRLREARRRVRDVERRLDQALKRVDRTAGVAEDLRTRLADAESEAAEAEAAADALRAELRTAKADEAAIHPPLGDQSPPGGD